MREIGHTVVYGDAEDPEFSSTLPLSHAQWVVSSVPQVTVNLALLQVLSRHGYSGRIATTAHNERDAACLKDAGSDLVILPFLDAAKEAVDQLCEPLAALSNSDAVAQQSEEKRCQDSFLGPEVRQPSALPLKWPLPPKNQEISALKLSARQDSA